MYLGKIEFVRLAPSIDETGKLQDIAINEKQRSFDIYERECSQY
jgi:hypothetical protein